ncbi:MAG TPA: polymer-forming cytoskeletal protein, partial [Vicinamibacteria bacterium]
GETTPRPVSAAPPPPAPSPAPARSAAPAPVATTACVIGAKTQFKGEITGSETVLVEGLVEGTIRITGDLRVGRGGTVKANVSAQSVAVAGELVGDCHAAQRVEIEASGRLTGNIRAPRVVIVEGATFRGNSDMSPRPDAKQG